MFRENKKHLQLQMLTTVDSLPETQSTRLAEGWAGTFYREFFSRIDEQAFATLYSAKDSRPNIPVNVLVGLEALKSGFGWSDEDMYDAFCFDLQVRYALGYRNLGEGQFDLRTVYNFRHRVSEHMLKTGDNLIDKAFEQVTDEQIDSFQLKTGKVRMDSTAIASNMRNLSRLHLLVEIVQRVHRMLNETDRALYASDFAPYIRGSSGQYVYRVKSEDGPAHMQRIGELMGKLLKELAAVYGKHPTYQMLQRVFTEHFMVEQERLRLKVGKELSAASLQSPDDLEATFREKNGRSHKGHVANVTETCDPDNPFQLIAKVQAAPNVTNDDDMLIEAVPSLKKRLDVNEVHTDGGYNSDESYQVLRENGITHVQTAIRGHSASTRIGLDAFDIIRSNEDKPLAGSEAGQRPGKDAASSDEHKSAGGTEATLTEPKDTARSGGDKPVQVTCPHGQTVAVEAGKGKERYLAHFDAEKCSSCPLQDKCPTRKLKQAPYRTLHFDHHDAEIARRRRRIAQDRQEGRNLRVAIESTIASLKHPFNYDQLPVRGLFRVQVVLISAAAMTNVRRIQRYLAGKGINEATTANKAAHQETEQTSSLFCLKLSSRFLSGLRSLWGNVASLAIRERQSHAIC